MDNLEDRIREIRESGDERQIFAFEFGSQRNSEFYPDEDTIEAYRTGLDSFFKRSGYDDLISAEEIIIQEDPSRQEGFFDVFRMWNSINEADFHKENFQKKLLGYGQKLNEGKLEESKYVSYLKGALSSYDLRLAILHKSINKIASEYHEADEDSKGRIQSILRSAVSVYDEVNSEKTALQELFGNKTANYNSHIYYQKDQSSKPISSRVGIKELVKYNVDLDDRMFTAEKPLTLKEMQGLKHYRYRPEFLGFN